MINNNHLSRNFLIRSMQVFIAKLKQNPGIYPIRHYKKSRRSRQSDFLY